MKLLQDTILARYTSLRTGGAAARLIALGPEDDLREVVAQASQEGPVWILGFGTNCLVSDKGLPGTVILNRTGTLHPIGNGFRAESGVVWDDLVQAAIGRGLWGLEFTSGIPGGVGAAVAGNIAAYGHKVADALSQATIFDPKTNQVTTWGRDQLRFGYRTSALQLAEYNHLVVLDATFTLSGQSTGDLQYDSALKVAGDMGVEPDSLANRRKVIMETRKRAGSLLSGSTVGPWTAGSFFKNPVVGKDQVEAILAHEEAGVTPEQLLRQNQLHGGDTARVSAALVLLAAGFHRGQTWGNVRLHADHILKLENAGQATAQEMYDVVQHILATVQEKLGIALEPEVRFLGEF